MSRVIQAEEQSAYERWELPEVSPAGRNSSAPHMNHLTAKQLEQLQKQAYAEAFQRGLKDGLAEAKAKASQFELLMNTLAEPLSELDDEVERELVALVMVIARHIVRREIKADQGQIIGVIREAVTSLPLSSRSVSIHLHPDDAVIVREILLSDGSRSRWQLVEDPVISRGGCRVMTEVSMIDATIETRLASIAAAVMGGERENDDSKS